MPILFVAPEAKIVAVVHAGWRGTLAGIAPKMIRLLNSQHDISPDGIEAALGPAIGPCCYEVKEDVSLPLVERWGKIAELCVEHRDGKTYLDLRRLNRAILEQAGVRPQQIYQVGPCTSCAPDEFFSYRREKKPNWSPDQFYRLGVLRSTLRDFPCRYSSIPKKSILLIDS